MVNELQLIPRLEVGAKHWTLSKKKQESWWEAYLKQNSNLTCTKRKMELKRRICLYEILDI